MNSQQETNAELRDLQVASLLAAGSIIASFAVYWIVQIIDVLEMLELAYG